MDWLINCIQKPSLRDYAKDQKIEQLEHFIEILQNTCYDWSQDYIKVQSRERNQQGDEKGGKRKIEDKALNAEKKNPKLY